MAITWGKGMSGSKHFDKIAWTITALILVVTILFMNGGALGLEVMAHTMGYENRLFDNTKVHTIDIVMDDWDEFIANATSEEYYAANVVIDGEACKNVGIRGKGNTSLSMVSSLGSERYSFKIEFDQYDSSITYHGLDKLSLNNLIQDSTMMKDYLTYTMMNDFGVAAPLCSFVYITANGEDWGLYLAVEGIEDSFLERNYSSDYGELYKPDSISFGGGRGNGKNFNMDDFMNNADTSNDSSASEQNTNISQMPGRQEGAMPDMGNIDPSQMQNGFGGGRGGMGMGSSDVKLQYIDDSIDSYSNIWNNAKTDINEADQTRLIESLEKLTNGEQIESVVDIEQVIRYFVVHNFVCNGDSYTGSMIHNYYLYEENGQLAMIPWDYNLAYGTFQGGNAQSTINTPIDSPVDGGSNDDRPMWNWVVANEEYAELYHQYFAEFLNTVDIESIIDNAYNLIKSYVEKDPTAFYTYDEFETGVETLRQFCKLRSESISTQLANGETASNMNYVDASGITLSDMGSMNMSGGGAMPDMGGNRGGFDRGGAFGGTVPDGTSVPETPTDGETVISGWSIQGTSATMTENNPQNGEVPEMPEGFDPSQMQEGAGRQMPGQAGNQPSTDGETPNDPNGTGETSRPSRDNMQMPDGDFNFNMNDMGNTASSNTNWIWLAVSALILGAGLIIAKLYKH